ncbi:MAG TPA: radical SAM family heme chaperone HemW [Caulobacteraceae bacterium]|nr:radical SAM family heme chaperone HemW [Caulobacteraceae bacterium]
MTLAPALGVYVHWPYCARICPYCDFNVVRERGRTQEKAALVEAILADLAAQAARIGFRRLVSIFFGGGTPSLMAPEAVGRIIEACRAHWPAEPDLEVTLEANPTDAEAGRFAAFAAAGVGRLSLGVQSLDDAALKALGRNHDAAAARRAMETAKTVFPRLSIDLIYARPDQTVAAWRAELAEALAFGPEHVSPYQLTIEAGTAFDHAVRRGTLRPPDEETAADLYEATQDVLGTAGFEAYEVSNHARGQAARSRHNLTYWRGEDYLGVGPGAHGRITLSDGRWATVSPKAVADYVVRVRDEGVGAQSERLTPREVALERLLMGLRTVEGVGISELAALPLDRRAVAELERAGLACAAGGRLRVTARGRPVLDRITAELASAPAVAG